MLMTVTEAADELRVSRSQVFLLIKSGTLPSMLVGPKTRRVIRSGLEEYIARGMAVAEAVAGHDAQPDQKAS